MTATLSPVARSTTSTTTARPLRVCHVSLTLKTGGLERILADLARHHSPEVCQPTFIAIREVGRFADEIRGHGCVVHQLQPAGRIGQIREMARLFREEQIDIVHTHNTYPHLYASVAARWAGVPVVIQTRHGQRAGHGWKSRVSYRWAAHLVDRVVAVSEDAARLCVDVDGLPTRKVQRIWNGIDLDQFEYSGPATKPVAIAVARLSAEKDFPTLLRAMALASQQMPDLQLQIVGEGPERTKLESLTRELGLTSRVEFLGERRDVPELLKQAGFFVTASLTEGISLTLLEAMAVGLPVVATDVGGNPEIVEDNITGLLAPAGQPDALAAAMVNMARNSSSWPTMGRAGRDRVCEWFDVRRMAADYEALYVELMQSRGQ
ncbi:MAG: GT4 family glycosyltransferase PelF [Planctomycetaceae bacterium]|nr:GT4 family glycosyltransferase PelF [Planctomycetaceae bacterium]